MARRALTFFTVLFLFGVSASFGQESEQRGVFREPVKIDDVQVHLLTDAQSEVDRQITAVTTALEGVERERDFGRAQGLLVEYIERGRLGVANTQDKFNKTADEGRLRSASDAYFGDLLASFDGARTEIKKASIADQKEFGWTFDNVLGLLEYTNETYALAADTKSLTFDLEVRSKPPDAAIRFHRRGDAATPNSDNTNTTIHNLVYARWFVEIHLDGYADQAKEHDATRERSHRLDFDLKK